MSDALKPLTSLHVSKMSPHHGFRYDQVGTAVEELSADNGRMVHPCA